MIKMKGMHEDYVTLYTYSIMMQEKLKSMMPNISQSIFKKEWKENPDLEEMFRTYEQTTEMVSNLVSHIETALWEK